MTIPALNSNSYTGDGTVASYGFTFVVQDKTHIRVVVRDAALVETLLTVTTDYTTTLNADGTGTVALVNASQSWLTAGNLKSGYALLIRRVVPVTQDSDIKNQGRFFGKTHEDVFDRLVMIEQQLDYLLSRALRLPETETPAADTTVVADATSRSSKFLGWNASGKLAALTGLTPGALAVSAFIETLLDDANAAAARTTLGLAGAGGTVQAAQIEDKAVTAAKLAGNAVQQIFQARLTLATGVPVTAADQTAKTTVYLTPYGGDKLALYDGTDWRLHTLTEKSAAVPGTTDTMYDVFVYDSAGTLTLDVVAWTNDTTRATALATQNGVLVKTGATGRRYVGSFRTTGVSGETEDSATKRYVWNYYNQKMRPMRVLEATGTWTYTTDTWRQARADAANQLDFVVGVDEVSVMAQVLAHVANDGAAPVRTHTGIGLDATAANSAQLVGQAETGVAAGYVLGRAEYRGFVGVGRHRLVWLERSVASGTTTWAGRSGSPAILQSGITGELLG